MQTRTLGKTGLKVSAIGFGAAEIGFANVTVDDASRTLHAVLDAGVNFIDTAAAYLTSEELIGQALGHRRSEVVLATKCGAVEGFSKSDWSKEGILRTVQKSLKHLKTDYVDLLFLHSCGELEMKWGEALQGVEAARDAGYTRFVGYSGDGPAALWAAGCGRFDVIETSLSILDQEALSLHLPIAIKNNLGVVIKRSLGNAVWRYTAPPENEYHLEYWKRWNALKYDFATQDSQHIAAMALRFTAFQPGVHCAIVGTTRPERLRHNIELLAAGPLEPAVEQHIRNTWKARADQYWVGQI
ncbi:MAG: aldo/keto reductase [Bdellovibrionota bacterium]|nr:MAG: aldo/keto reductase [Bdellovibrionota bacterium]